MKILLTTLCFAVIISCKKESSKNIQSNSPKDSLSVKNEPISVQNDSIKTIDDIKKEYASLNTLLTSKKLDSTTFTYNCDKTEQEGEVVFYYQDKKLKIVKNSYSEHSHFSSSTKYFIKEDQVFFIFNDETVWGFDGGTPENPETKDDVKEKRLYYINGKLEYCRDKKYTLRSKNNSKPENVSDGENKNCNDTELRKTFEAILKNKDKKGDIQCL